MGGELNLSCTVSKLNLALTNQFTVTWTSPSSALPGNSTAIMASDRTTALQYINSLPANSPSTVICRGSYFAPAFNSTIILEESITLLIQGMVEFLDAAICHTVIISCQCVNVEMQCQVLR